MTTSDRFPRSNPDRDSIDLHASRLLDGDIAQSDVPDDIRVDVADRVREFTALRSRMRSSADSMAGTADRRETMIAVALAARSKRSTRFASLPVRIGIAASITAIVAVSTVAITRNGTTENVMIAETMGDAGSAPIAASESQTMTIDDSAQSTAKGSAIDDTLSPDAPIEYDSMKDIARWVASIDTQMSRSEAPGLTPPRNCPIRDEVPLLIEKALLHGRPIDIHVFSTEEFVVYDSDTCAIVTEVEQQP